MKNRHEGPIPKDKNRCYKCQGWGIEDYSRDGLNTPVCCSVCEGLGLVNAPVYPTVDEEFDGWLSAHTHDLYTDEEEVLARAAWKAAQERYGDGN